MAKLATRSKEREIGAAHRAFGVHLHLAAPQTAPRITKFDLLLIFLVSLIGFWGGTANYHPDFLTAFVGRVFENGGNPQFFHYGCLMIYAHCVVYGITYVLLRLFGVVHSTGEFQRLIDTEYLLKEPIQIGAFIPGLIFTVLLSFLALAAVFWLALRVTGKKIPAYLAVLMLGTSFQWVADTHFLTVDVPMAALLIAGIALSLHFSDRVAAGTLSNTRLTILMGIFAGLIAGSKYPGGLIALPFFIVAVFLAPKSESRWKPALLLPLSALLTFLVTNPFVILDFRTFWNHFYTEVVHARAGHPGYMADSFFFHTKVTLRDSFGILGLVLSLTGYFLFACSRRVPIREKILLLIYPFLQYLLISKSHLAFQRYIVPMMPFIALFFAYGLFRIEQAIRARLSRAGSPFLPAFLRTALAAAVILPNASLSIQSNQLLLGTDSRDIFLKAIEGKDLGGFYVANYLKYFVRNRPVSEDRRLNALFLDSFTYDRDLYEECRLDPQLIPMFADFDRVLIINPFDREKDLVPFSPQSLFSPALPDLPMRKIAGPYIEIYYSSSGPLSRHWESLEGPLVSKRPAVEGYYRRKLPAACRDVANRKKLEIEDIGYEALHSARM